MSENLDLFGWPVAEPRDKAGRPEHVRTEENVNKIMMLIAFGFKNSEVAAAIGVSQPTLRKHYFQALDQRRVAGLMLKAKHFEAVYTKAIVDRDSTMLKELGKLIEKHDLAEVASKFGEQTGAARTKMGKKQVAQVEAQTAGEGSDWGDDLQPIRPN